MKYRLAVSTALLWAAVAAAQSQTVSRALEPNGADLERLNLLTVWRVSLAVTDRGDGIVSVQPVDDQVFVQLRSGRVVCIQAEFNPKTFRKAGDILWQLRPERRPGMVRPLAVGPKEIYLAHDDRLTILDRADGKVKYSEVLLSNAAAAPSADSKNVYIPLTSRKMVAYKHSEIIAGYRPPRPIEYPDPVDKVSLKAQAADALSTPANRSPSITAVETLRPPFQRAENQIDISPSVATIGRATPPYRAADAARSPSVSFVKSLRDIYELTDPNVPTKVKFGWELLIGGKLEQAPVLTGLATEVGSDRVMTATANKVLVAEREGLRNNFIATEYTTTADISAQLVVHGDTLYVATADANFLALSCRDLRDPTMAANTLPKGKFTTGGAIVQKPLATENSVYVIGSRWGLMRLSKTTLEPQWIEELTDGRTQPRPNKDVAKLLAVNANFVYAQDEQGGLVVIDAVRGHTLSRLPMQGFDASFTNELNDRIYLASGAGLIVCVRDRRRVLPEPVMKPVPVKKAEPVEEKKEPVEEKKDPEPKKAEPEPKKAEADPKKENN